jgi:transcriptional regulator with XRE-family HTH domain/KaiC/GvpD/RAD55 family RecA-like ATPase
MAQIGSEKLKVASGVDQLDFILEGLFIGDNVVWYDDAGSLASVFCLNFIQISQAQKKPLIYVTFDRSPKNLLEKLGPLAQNPDLFILDCFTFGKGAGSSIFLEFYEQLESQGPFKLVQVENPRDMRQVTEALYALHSTQKGDVRFVFESLTGMQELWGGEDQVLNFYSHSCPRLYELKTIAYWVMEKKAHSPRFRAQISQIAQVAIDLSIKRGTTSLTILKAEKRKLDNLHQPHKYWVKDLNITFDDERRPSGLMDLGQRIKALRLKRGLSQTELAQSVGVTPSTISQVESNLIYPSLPALFKMAEILAVEGSSFFLDQGKEKSRVIFPLREATDLRMTGMPEFSIQTKRLTPVDLEAKAEPFLIEIPPRQTLSSHFFFHKGEEMGYLLDGKLSVKMPSGEYELLPGDLIHLTSEIPNAWSNLGPDPARLLWLLVK